MMKIPQEIQDLMPERKDISVKEQGGDIGKGMVACPGCATCGQQEYCCCEEYNQALTEVEKVLPQMLAEAEKRGAEREAYKWFDSWYAYYVNNSLVGEDDFGKWASKRLQSLGAEEDTLTRETPTTKKEYVAGKDYPEWIDKL